MSNDGINDAYRRLIAAQRIVTPEEQAQFDTYDARQKQQLRIKRKLSKVY